ncbi:response regulator transcription factor [Dyella mobilis]|uniref:Response regulator transcription factor n=2 Tax=Dyella mobilis TaxID=1849582 RepID=A0ABS2KM15_9GAMM|nr:response regulator transcription factor [Dyella mobilis]
MLLDDHPVVRFGLRAQLETASDIDLVGDYESTHELLSALAVRGTDVLVMDYALGPREIDGLSLLRMLRSRHPNLRILVVSGHYNVATVAMVMRIGARGFVGKNKSMDEFVDAVRTVAAGQRYVDAGMRYELEQVAGDEVSESSGVPMFTTHAALSPREREVLRCVLDGMAVTAIAAKFSRSVNTISTQKQAAYRKLGIRTDTELFKIQHQLNGVAH